MPRHGADCHCGCRARGSSCWKSRASGKKLPVIASLTGGAARQSSGKFFVKLISVNRKPRPAHARMRGPWLRSAQILAADPPITSPAHHRRSNLDLTPVGSRVNRASRTFRAARRTAYRPMRRNAGPRGRRPMAASPGRRQSAARTVTPERQHQRSTPEPTVGLRRCTPASFGCAPS